MKSILIIHIYFGKLPPFFHFWLKSCEANQDIDFLIVTDNQIRTDAKNIKVYNCSLDEIRKRAERLFGFHVSLNTPHKLCDYKPLFGLLFDEFTRGYDFWGYCDSDLIFGKIRNFITDQILSEHDYILGMGHFHLQLTNDKKFEAVWKTARGVGDNAYYEAGFNPTCFLEQDNGMQWKAVFQSPENQIFDEFPYGVSGRYYRLYPDRVWTGYSAQGRCFDDVDPVPLYLRDLFNTYHAYKNSTYEKLTYIFPFFTRISNEANELDDVIYEKNASGLYRVGVDASGEILRQECLYAHFLHRKIHIRTKKTDRYLIRPNSVIDYEDVTPAKLHQWRNNKWLFVGRKWKLFMFQVKRSKTLWKKIKKSLS